MYKPTSHYLLFDFKVVLGPILINCRTVLYRDKKHLSEMNNFIHQNKLDSVSALCLKKMALEIFT